MTRPSQLRAMTLIEMMVTIAVGATVVAFGTGALVEQVRRNRANDAAHNALFPHTVARDRAVAARSCTETILVPPLGQVFAPPATIPAPAVPAQARVPQVAVILWDACEGPANVIRIDLYPLEGEINFTNYDTSDGRLVFAPHGGVTDDRPGVAAGLAVCGVGGGETGPKPPIGGGDGGGAGGTCTIPPSRPPPTPADVTFAATTYFGQTSGYRVFATVGATEGS